MQPNILEIKNLSISVPMENGNKQILRSVNFSVKENAIASLVGGSGSGKTTLGLAVLRLLAPALRVESGEILFAGKDLLNISEEKMRLVRGKLISMVFQEPLNAFNPTFKIGYQIEEVLKIHCPMNPKARQERVYDLLRQSGIQDCRRVAENYPHQLSGGLRQRAMIAQAIAANPRLMIADEPTSNLDVTLQAKILELFMKLQKELNLTIVLITHDLDLVKHFCKDVTILNKGEVVESGEVAKVLQSPQHPYTQDLLSANQF